MRLPQMRKKWACPVFITSIVTFSILLTLATQAWAQSYSPRGIGGGGAMSGLSLSPYAKLWFVGTDMGTLFRSTDEGKSWRAISHQQVVFDSQLARSSSVGFSSDPKVVFFAAGGKNPKRSADAGVTWTSIPLALGAEEFVRYWLGDSSDASLMYCATTHGLWRSMDAGLTWTRALGVSGDSRGSVVHGTSAGKVLLHANAQGIYLSKNRGKTFEPWFTPPKTGILTFTGGSNADLSTLAFVDTDGKKACEWARHARDSSEEQIQATLAECGYVWIASAPNDGSWAPRFVKTQKDGGRFIRMAENDPRTIYLTGGNWVRQYGSKVWVSEDAGKKWELRLHLMNWDTRPYSPWPKEKLEYSAVALDVGWHDNAYPSFVVNQRNSAQAGGTGYYFLHVTKDHGKTWKAPFTEYADQGERAPGKKWRSVGLEVTSIQKLKFHPRFPQIGYVGAADIGGLVTEDGGETWRISKCKYNTNYDYAFDPSEQDLVYAASGSVHDFPLGNSSILEGTEGGIFKSADRGKTWQRLTPATSEWNVDFLSVAFDSTRKVLYAGTRGRGVARSRDGGRSWEYFNSGLPTSGKIIPQIEFDEEKGTVYALLSGDAPAFSNQKNTGIYILDLAQGAKSWKLLRGNIQSPKGMVAGYQPWWFPTAFAIDYSRPKRDVLWLVDMESKGSWLGSGVWKSTDSGANWQRLKQFTHPTMVTLDARRPQRVYVSGLYRLDGSWGEGGALYSTDGGMSWKKNDAIPLLANLDGTVIDPNHPEKIFYLFFGGGILYGREPKE